jgi:hypothetical protein
MYNEALDSTEKLTVLKSISLKSHFCKPSLLPRPSHVALSSRSGPLSSIQRRPESTLSQHRRQTARNERPTDPREHSLLV